MTYVHAPFKTEIIDPSDLRDVMSALDNAGNAPVLLHCANSNRAGTVWALYTGLQDHLAVDEAIAEGKDAGMREPATEKAVRAALSKR